jgi:hypothetical protein
LIYGAACLYLYAKPYHMSQVIFRGDLTNAVGCAAALKLYQYGTRIWTSPDLLQSFSIPQNLSPGDYTLNIDGTTQGTLTFSIQGAVTGVNPATPKDYHNNIGGQFDFTVI